MCVRERERNLFGRWGRERSTHRENGGDDHNDILLCERYSVRTEMGGRKRDTTETSELARRDLSLPSRISIKGIDFQPVLILGQKTEVFFGDKFCPEHYPVSYEFIQYLIKHEGSQFR